MATDLFLKIEGIAGESKDARHRDEIDVLSWSWGESNTGGGGFGGGVGAAGKVSLNDFTFTHRVDAASPALMLACATGRHARDAVFVARKAGDKPLDFLVVKLTDVLVSSVAVAGSGEDAGIENVALGFSAITVEYRRQAADGSQGPSTIFEFDRKRNGPGR